MHLFKKIMPSKKRKSSAPKSTLPEIHQRDSLVVFLQLQVVRPLQIIVRQYQLARVTTLPVISISNSLIDYDQLAAAILKQKQQAVPSTSCPFADTQLQASMNSNTSIDVNNANLLNNLQ